ncbi:MAG: glucosylceramidase [Bacteroidales bacterium]|nr:glucosylceramidase [Bacteroidales bacterium]
MHIHLISVFLLTFLTACNGVVPQDEPEAPVEGDRATVYTTTAAGVLFKESTVALGKPGDVNFYKVTLNGESYQSVDGFGMAITQASCYNLLKMSAEDRSEFLKEIFSPDKGIGSSLIRVCIGGSDFSLDEFTCCDKPGIENFAMHPSDVQYLFPVLDEIMRINPDVKIIGSPWSCPRWMKVTESGGVPYDKWTAGRLNPDCYEAYAEYFVRWIKAMEQRGYHISAVTLQNEPLNRGNSMSLYMSWQDQAEFIKKGIGPAFKKAGLATKVLAFDHNYNYDNIADQKDYPLSIFKDPEASAYVAGSAWHNYGGSVSVLDGIHAAYPDKEIYFTEASIGQWNYSFASCLINDFRDIFLGTLGRYGKGVTLWNLMLDDHGKPNRPGGCTTCYGAVEISSLYYSLKSITRNSHYYNVAHCSKVLKPGAVRLGTEGAGTQGLSFQWYRNPDGSYAVLLLNEGTSDALVNFVTDKHSVSCKVPPRAIQSVVWTD